MNISPVAIKPEAPVIVMRCLRDWASIAQQQANPMLGTHEAELLLTESKRYRLAADTIELLIEKLIAQ